METDPHATHRRFSSSVDVYIDAICDQFELAWKNDRRPVLEDYLVDCVESKQSLLLHELVLIDITYCRQHGESPKREEYQKRFPNFVDVIAGAFTEIDTCAMSNHHESTPRQADTGPSPGKMDDLHPPGWQESIPERIGRYDVLELIDSGNFGSVYLAHDQELNRKVAIKVPRSDRTAEPDYVSNYVKEAQTVANLDHPNIVEVHDFGQTDDGRCFVVSKWIEGTDLAKIIKNERPSFHETAEMLATIADALQYAHSRKVIHRDIKPANILIDLSGQPYVADFGLALRDEDWYQSGTVVGTPAYMSPEQARGEGHLVDGRSDIFSLGVVLYELLTGERPFTGSSQEIRQRIMYPHEVRPPRQLASEVPEDLERICLKALAKRATDRYPAAVDLGEDLRKFLIGSQNRPKPTSITDVQDAPLPSDTRLMVVPKGLRSFDGMDADFFLELLPGPRDRNGLPESIRFWKSCIECLDGDKTFRVAVIYGPSGCGKSSLVKAGLLPRLADYVHSIYIESNGTDDEHRLLRSLRREHKGLGTTHNLVETMVAVRRGQGVSKHTKTLIVLDQFEQWLHANVQPQSQLISALRHCDGERIQCIVLVRDDFWMAVSRFMGQLEVRLIEGQNSAAVDLFDPLHAQKVLAEFGRAYGRIPILDVLTKEQESFLQQAISGLTRDNKIVPVRLALFAEMMKGKPWTLGELKSFGGTHGVTTTFLEETFCLATAPPEHRKHQRAAKAVLQKLLPEGISNIKGHMRSRTELLEASEYQDNPQAFADLMRILDTETRLLTPIEPDSAAINGENGLAIISDEKYYHLTHDYLVQPLRQWLTSKQRETRRGRAELTLSERSSLWNMRPEKKQLPFGWEWLSILLLTNHKKWTTTQKQMMRAATNLHLVFVLTVLSLIVGFQVWRYVADEDIRNSVAQVRTAWKNGNVKDALVTLGNLHDQDHPAIKKLISEMSIEGGATLDIQPHELEVEVLTDSDATSELGRFRSGDHVLLKVGHYRIRVYMGSTRLAELPFYIDQVAYDLTTGDRLQPTASAQRTPKENNNSQHFVLAEQSRLSIRIPWRIPKDYVYVNPGFGWYSLPPTTIDGNQAIVQATADGEKMEVETHNGSDILTREYLEHGFLIRKFETSVGEFRSWWNCFGSEFCDWKFEIYARIEEAKAETRDVPVSVHRGCWGNNVQRHDLSYDQILTAAFEHIHSPLKKHWEAYHLSTSERLNKISRDDDRLPATVGWETAIAYARTHDDIDPSRFRRWVAKMKDDAHQYKLKLEKLHEAISRKNADLVELDELPTQPLVRDLLNAIEVNEYPRPILEAYVYWLKIRTYYGWQLPIDQILARSASDSPQLKLVPTTWLWPKRNGETIRGDQNSPERTAVNSYAVAIKYGNEKPNRRHFLNWLGWMINQEIAEEMKYSDLLRRLNDSEQNTLDTIPFAIRYRYGMHLGWDIPTWQEWERAFRGADDRAYVWGQSREEAWVHRGPGKRPLSTSSDGDPVNDKSPYGVLHMAGNVSEWVRGKGSPMERLNDESDVMVPKWNSWSYVVPVRVYLKGGNYIMDDHFMNAGYTLSLQAGGRLLSKGGLHTMWTGFRVIRRENGFQ